MTITRYEKYTADDENRRATTAGVLNYAGQEFSYIHYPGLYYYSNYDAGL